jgi:hypothetical protein
MPTLSVLTWIGNAAAVLTGAFGAITRQTQQAGCSRQVAYQHAHKVQQAVKDAQLPGPSREQLLQENQRLAEENRQLWQALEDSIDLPRERQQRFAVSAAACGVSLSTTRVLLDLLLDQRAPSRATLGRWVAGAGRRAGAVLTRLDDACRSLVTAVCLDEIYCHHRPILVGVEPRSLACVVARRAEDCTGETWVQTLAPWSHVRRAVADGGLGLQKGLTLAARQRQQAGPPLPLQVIPDLFHLTQDASRVLRRTWRAAEATWQRHDQKRAAYERLRRQLGWRHKEYHSAEQLARWAWVQAQRAYEQAQAQEAAWRRARGAFEVFRPDGVLNDRSWAQAEVAAALPGLPGKAWAKVRRFLESEPALNFLDELHRDLAAAEPQEELRGALVRLWRLRQQQRRQGPQAEGAAAVLAVPLQELVCAKLSADWRAAEARVSAVLRRVVRASSVVECMNSVWRMHQSRHRQLTQELLDLKRLWWNVRVFLSGKRQKQRPYERLGLRLPTYDLWELLQGDPDTLTQQVSTQEIAA